MQEIRIIAPSDSWKTHREDAYERSRIRLNEAGYEVTYAKNVKAVSYLGTADAKLRAEDLNNAFADSNVKAIICLHGGFAANEVLPYIDWKVVKSNPKPIVGYSDITVLVNAIHAMTGMTTYLGPNLGTIGHEDLWEYSLSSLLSAFKERGSYALEPSKKYIDEKKIHKAKSWRVIQEGTAKGRLIGGNAQTLFLLQGTPYQPNFDQDYILAIEDDALSKEYTLHGFTRNLESILQIPNARKNLKGILIGRFEAASCINDAELMTILKSKNLVGIPIVSNLDFGHTSPTATLPIGSLTSLNAQDGKIDIVLGIA